MSKKNLFVDDAPEKREEMLKGMADKTDLQPVRRFYTEDESHQMKDFLSTETIQLLDQKDEFAAIKKEFNKAIKAHNEQIVGVAKDLKRGFSEATETVYGIADHENDMMDFYDSKGNYINSRRLLPSEHQTKMLSLENKTGTDDH